MNHYRHLKTVFLLLILLIAFPALAISGQYKVSRVVDGDTIDINYNGAKERVRLLCVNTPESVHRDAKQNIPMGKVASDYAKKKLSGKYIDLEFEGERLRGNYGRLLAYVFVDGQNFNLDLVRQGLSPYYTKYGRSQKYDADFRGAEKLARKEKLNIWGDPDLTEKYLRLKSKWGQTASSAPAAEQQEDVQGAGSTYIGNKRSHKLHRTDCRYVKQMSMKNRHMFTSRRDAINQGYVPCKVCQPWKRKTRVEASGWMKGIYGRFDLITTSSRPNRM
ncbi:thermonuclease family protein [Thermodesulfobacteriota bacterium]